MAGDHSSTRAVASGRGGDRSPSDRSRGMRAEPRVAVIGAGFMGERHARIFAGLPDVELVAVCDVREGVGPRAGRADGRRGVHGLPDAAQPGRPRRGQRVHARRAPPRAVRAGDAGGPSRAAREADRHHGGRRRGDRGRRRACGRGAAGRALPPVRPALRSGPAGRRAGRAGHGPDDLHAPGEYRGGPGSPGRAVPAPALPRACTTTT